MSCLRERDALIVLWEMEDEEESFVYFRGNVEIRERERKDFFFYLVTWRATESGEGCW